MLMKVLNESLMERKVDAHYVALLLMLWDPDTGRFTMANAGATPPMICRGGKIIRPQVEGVPVGLLDDQNYEETIFETEPGDMLILYSDGIQDQQGNHEIEYGRNQLAIALAHYGQQSVRKVAEGIFTDLDRYMGHQAVFDDQTLIAIKVSES